MGAIVHVGSIPTLRDLLEKMRPQVMLAAAKHLDGDRVLRVTLTAVQRDSKLLRCSQESLLRALMTCTQLGLEPDGRRAHLVAYGENCTLVIGYPGLIELAIRSGFVRNIVARVVRKGDEFEYSYGTEEFVRHVPAEDPKAELLHAYAIAFLVGGGTQFDVMTKKQIDAIKARAAAKRGPWAHEQDYFEMARKTPVRRLCKYLPASPELAKATQLDEQAELGLPQDLLPLDGSMAALPAPTRTQEAKEKAKRLRPAAPPPPDSFPEDLMGPTGGEELPPAEPTQDVPESAEPPPTTPEPTEPAAEAPATPEPKPDAKPAPADTAKTNAAISAKLRNLYMKLPDPKVKEEFRDKNNLGVITDALKRPLKEQLAMIEELEQGDATDGKPAGTE